jgi:hypothetical protein
MKKALPLLLLSALGTGAFAQCPNGQTEVTMTVVTDAYGSETTWTITGATGTPVYASGGPYTDVEGDGETVNFCVPDGSTIYITVEDAYGDGMCCAYGDGGWTVNVGSTTVSSGGSFGTEENATVTLGTDLGINSLDVPGVIAQGSTTITGTVKNNGIVAVNGYTLAYTMDGGTPVSQNFSGSIAPGTTANFSFSTPWNASVGPHTISLDMSGVANDALAANNSLNGSISVATQSVQRVALIEGFTSSTCAPCASFNAQYDPILESVNTNQAGSNIAAVKYQMNWPSPGNDPSYNPDGVTRRTYYGVSGIPDYFLDGKSLTQGTEQELMDAAAVPAFVSMCLEVSRTGLDVNVNVGVTSYADFGTGYKLQIAAVEEFYSYPASTTSQDEFHFAERKMLPNGSGNTLSSMTTGGFQSVEKSYTFVEGGPAQGNYNLWGTLDEGVIVVAFVQNTSTKEVLQAVFVKVPATGQTATSCQNVSVEEVATNVSGMSVYPNPATDNATVQFNLNASDRGTVEVLDIRGSRVMSLPVEDLQVGLNKISLNTSDLNSGLYMINLNLESGRVSRRLTVNK